MDSSFGNLALARSDASQAVAMPASDCVIAADGSGIKPKLKHLIARLSTQRVRLSLFALTFDDVPAALAASVAVAACGTTGLLGVAGPGRFVILDIGPHQARARGDAAISEGLRQRARRALEKSAASGARVTLAEFHGWSDGGHDIALLLDALLRRDAASAAAFGIRHTTVAGTPILSVVRGGHRA